MTYDFNATYSPLPVHDQHQEGDCWFYAHALALVAIHRMHEIELDWTDPLGAPFTWAGTEFRGQLGGRSVRFHQAQDVAQVSLNDPDALRAALDRMGVAPIAVAQPHSLTYAPQNAATLPLIVPEDGDTSAGGHSLLAVGHVAAGVIVQNSWSRSWGHNGRAVLSWEWLARFGSDFGQNVYDDYPLEAATRPPQPYKASTATPEDDMPLLLARRTANSPVWCFMGGVRSFISKAQVLAPQGLSMDDVKVIPGTHLLWTATTPIGPLPNGKDW